MLRDELLAELLSGNEGDMKAGVRCWVGAVSQSGAVFEGHPFTHDHIWTSSI